LLFLSFAQAVCFDKKSEILWSCSSVVWALSGYLGLRLSVFVDGETWHFAEPSSKGAMQGMRTGVCGRSLL
jgi:hypothetical protein